MPVIYVVEYGQLRQEEFVPSRDSGTKTYQSQTLVLLPNSQCSHLHTPIGMSIETAG